MVWYTLEQHVFLCDTYVKYGSARKCQWKFLHKFHDKRVPRRQTTHNLVNKLRSIRLLIDKKQKHKHQVFTEEKSDDIGVRLEHMRKEWLKHLAQEAGVSKSSARMTTQLLKLRPYRTTVIHALQPYDPFKSVYLCSWFLQSVVECGINLQLTGTAFSTPVICELQLLYSEHYWPTGILNRQQNSYAPHSLRFTSRCEVQSHEPPCISCVPARGWGSILLADVYFYRFWHNFVSHFENHLQHHIKAKRNLYIVCDSCMASVIIL
jgi:hypothetical protein